MTEGTSRIAMILINANEAPERRARLNQALKEHIVDVPAEMLKGLDLGFYDGQGQKVLIELKEVPADLIASVNDGRLFRQRMTLADHQGPGFFLFENFPQITKEGYIRNGKFPSGYTLKAFLGFILSCYQRGIGVLWSPTPDFTPMVLLETWYYMQKAKHHETRQSPEYAWTGRPTRAEWLIYFYQGFPGIGPEAAASLADVFPAPKDLVNAEPEQLENVPHIGPKRAQTIYNRSRGI